MLYDYVVCPWAWTMRKHMQKHGARHARAAAGATLPREGVATARLDLVRNVGFHTDIRHDLIGTDGSSNQYVRTTESTVCLHNIDQTSPAGAAVVAYIG